MEREDVASIHRCLFTSAHNQAVLFGTAILRHRFRANLGREKESWATENRRSATYFTPYGPKSTLWYICVFPRQLWCSGAKLEGCVICISVKQSSIAAICMRLIRHVTKALCSPAIMGYRAEVCFKISTGLLLRLRLLFEKPHVCDF